MYKTVDFIKTEAFNRFQLLFHIRINCSNMIIVNIFVHCFFFRTRQKVEEYKYNIKPESK